MPLGYLLFDAHFRIVDWNPAAERLFGYRKDEMIGLNPSNASFLPRPCLRAKQCCTACSPVTWPRMRSTRI